MLLVSTFIQRHDWKKFPD